MYKIFSFQNYPLQMIINVLIPSNLYLNVIITCLLKKLKKRPRTEHVVVKIVEWRTGIHVEPQLSWDALTQGLIWFAFVLL